MTHQEILEKAWEVATERAWEFDNLDKWQTIAVRKTDTVMNNWYQFIFTHDNMSLIIDAERIIYSHDFAKALWPTHIHAGTVTKSFTCKRCRESALDIECYKRMLQKMVIADDPIEYLGEHLDEETI